jgi:predicted HAD superfamily Cof-like phosphohydrolase
MSYPKQSFYDDVGEFHEKFNQPYFNLSSRCEFPTTSEIGYRISFMLEELNEFIRACYDQDLPKALDALVDLTYVTLGTAHYFNAPFAAAWDEVHAANMRKVRAVLGDTDHKRGSLEPMRKPPGWMPPNIELVLQLHNQYVIGESR